MDAERIYRPSPSSGALRQGEILTDLAQLLPRPGTLSGELEYEIRVHPFAIVVTQDCDLDLDYKARAGEKPDDKRIPSVLLCEVETAEVMQQKVKNSKIWDRIKINADERYQFLQAAQTELDALGQGLPELGIDFKRYFALTPEELIQRIASDMVLPGGGTVRAARRVVLNSPYLEHFSTRFGHYLARVALPEPHASE